MSAEHNSAVWTSTTYSPRLGDICSPTADAAGQFYGDMEEFLLPRNSTGSLQIKQIGHQFQITAPPGLGRPISGRSDGWYGMPARPAVDGEHTLGLHTSLYFPDRPVYPDVEDDYDDTSDEVLDGSSGIIGHRATHPNTFPVEIEYHNSKLCNYKRQIQRSGERVVPRLRPVSAIGQPLRQGRLQVKYYEKHLTRICGCGNYPSLDEAHLQGQNHDCNGYEIHYSQKCRWKAYDDFKTGDRVLIRLCKCYKPA